MKRKQTETRCDYHGPWARQFFNHGGCLPCGQCGACRSEAESLQRVKRWNEETAKGAKANR